MNTFVSNGVLGRTRCAWLGLDDAGSATCFISAALKILATKRLMNLVGAPAILTAVGSLLALAERSNRWTGLDLGSTELLLTWVIRHATCWAAVTALSEGLLQMALMIALKMCR